MRSCLCSFYLVSATWFVLVRGDFKLLVLHTNDMHARFDQTSQISSKCGDKDVKNNNCYGGFARVAQVVKEARERARSGQGPPVLFLNAGDTYQGTIWYSVHKWRVVADLTNQLGMDAASLGNHEFDDGVAGLVPFIKNVTYPILAANVDVRKEPTLAATDLKKSVILTVAGKKIGIIGYLTPETKDIADTGLVEIKDEVMSIRQEAEHLKTAGADILIALGHAGYDVDRKIAAEVADIDLVVGGHTNTFLYTGKPPDPTNEVQGPYPTVVRQKSGKRVPVVQAYAYTKYIGHLELDINDRGEVTSWKGNPILLDKTVQQDPTILKALEPWREGVDKKNKMTVGQTKVYLKGDGRYCRMGECNLGNLLTDAFIYYWVSTTKKIDAGWTEAPIAMMNSGGIRADIDISNESDNAAITMGDVMTTLPFENSLVFVHLKGEHVLEALEWGVSRYDPKGMAAPGAFLQFSGLRVQYDVCKPVNQRVVTAMVRCGDCRVPEYKPVDPQKTYGILLPTYISNGGDGFKFKTQYTHHRILDTTDTGVLASYITKMSPIYPGVEGRIIFSNTTCNGGPATTPQANSSTKSIETHSILVFLLGALLTVGHS